MALMDKPTDPNPEEATETDRVIALEEDGDVEKENTEYWFWMLDHIFNLHDFISNSFISVFQKNL